MDSKTAVLNILGLALNAPQLKIGDYNEEQVIALNDAMIQIYKIAFSVVNERNSGDSQALAFDGDLLLSKLEKMKTNLIASQDKHMASREYKEAAYFNHRASAICEVIDMIKSN